MEPVTAKAPKSGSTEPRNQVSTNEWTNQRASAQALRAANARQASGRRRFVDPTTCERDYTTAEMEFMSAMHNYKQSSGRMFPTWSEILEVLQGLGYEKAEDLEILPEQAAQKAVQKARQLQATPANPFGCVPATNGKPPKAQSQAVPASRQAVVPHGLAAIDSESTRPGQNTRPDRLQITPRVGRRKAKVPC